MSHMVCCLSDQAGVKFVAFFATLERNLGLVLADFAWQRFFLVAADVWRITDNEIAWWN